MVHIVFLIAELTYRPESKHFLSSEVIEYGNRAGEIAKTHGWNVEDRKYIQDESIKKIKDKLSVKYSDIKYSEQEAMKKLVKFMDEII